MKPLHEWTADDVRNAPIGSVIYTEQTSPGSNGTGYFVIASGQLGLCAYVCVPANHPLAALDFDADPFAYGGANYDATAWWDPQIWAWGWDYAHLGDEYMFAAELQQIYDEWRKERRGYSPFQQRTWLPIDVWTNCREACDALNEAMREAEAEAARRSAAGEPQPLPRRGRTMEQYDLLEGLMLSRPQ